MTALAQERLTPAGPLTPSRGTFGMKANTRIFKGAMVGLDSAGRAMPAGLLAGGTVRAVGKASSTIDNRTGSELGGSADAADCEVEYGVFGYASGTEADAIDQEDVGKLCYVIDDQTVGLTDGSATRAVAGFISEYRDGLVWVAQSPVTDGQVNADLAVLTADANTAQARLVVPLSSFYVKSTGAPGIAFNGGVADGYDYLEGMAYRFNVASTAAIAATVPLPPDLDDAEDMVLHVLGARVGSADATAALTVECFFQPTGAAYDADADCGGDTTAFDGATTVVTEETLTIDAADVAAAPGAVSITLVPTAALDADDLRVLAVWFEYTRTPLSD